MNLSTSFLVDIQPFLFVTFPSIFSPSYIHEHDSVRHLLDFAYSDIWLLWKLAFHLFSYDKI